MAPPGTTARGPRGYVTINLIRATGSARRQKAFLESILNDGATFDFEIWTFASTDNVYEFLKHIGGDKERYRATEIREQGDGTWSLGGPLEEAGEGGCLSGE